MAKRVNLPALAARFGGRYVRQQDRDHEGALGVVYVFRWDDEDDSDRFVAEITAAGAPPVDVTHDFERGVLTSCVRYYAASSEVR